MNRINKSCGGFTIIELLVASLTFSVLMLVVGSLLVYSWRGWVRSNQMVSMQRNATIAMMMISKEIRNSKYDDITDGEGISFGGSGVSFTELGNRIVHSDGSIVVDGGLVAKSFKTTKLQGVNAAGKTNQWVEISFTLETAAETVPYASDVSPRNRNQP